MTIQVWEIYNILRAKVNVLAPAVISGITGTVKRIGKTALLMFLVVHINQ